MAGNSFESLDVCSGLGGLEAIDYSKSWAFLFCEPTKQMIVEADFIMSSHASLLPVPCPVTSKTGSHELRHFFFRETGPWSTMSALQPACSL